jgi:hypothetical protein
MWATILGVEGVDVHVDFLDHQGKYNKQYI